MGKAKPADPNWLTFDEVRADPELGHTSTRLNRYIRDGIPLLNHQKLTFRKEYREIERGRFGKMVLRRLVVNRAQLVADRKRAAELRVAKPTSGLLTDEALAAWGIGAEATLKKLLKKGKVSRVEETFLRPNKGKGTRFRWSLVGGQANGKPLKAAPLVKVPRKKVIGNEMHYSAAEVASQLKRSVESVYQAAAREEWHGVPFKPVLETYGEKDEVFYFGRGCVRAVKKAIEDADAVGYRGRGTLPPDAVPQCKSISGVECEAVHFVAERNGLNARTFTNTWNKPKGCRHVRAGQLIIKRFRNKPYIPIEQVAELERSLKADRDAGSKGVGRPLVKREAFAWIQGDNMPKLEWCIRDREAARLLEVKVQIIRQWHFRKNAPGLAEQIRFHSRARAWSYMPVEQFVAIAAAKLPGVRLELPEPDPRPNSNVPAAINGRATKVAASKRGRGRPEGTKKYDPEDDQKLRTDYESSNLRSIPEFARLKGMTRKEVIAAFTRVRARRK